MIGHKLCLICESPEEFVVQDAGVAVVEGIAQHCNFEASGAGHGASATRVACNGAHE